MELKTIYEQSPLRVAVLLGGDSAETRISLSSGEAVAAALRAVGHDVRLVDPADTELRTLDWSEVDVAFNMLHGTFGEDGQVQTILEAASVPYTGSGPDSSRLAFSKSAAKERFRLSGVATPESALFHRSDSTSRLTAIADSIGYPLVLKPDQQGSSLGVRIVHSPAELVPAARHCFQFGDYGLLECAVSGGGEWTLAVFDGQPLPLIRITPPTEFFDFSAKYEDDRTAYTFDVAEPEELTREIVRTGLAACRALGTVGIARVDLLVDAAGRPWVLEVNTVPGMTDHSLVPKAALRAGISLAELCDAEVHAALHRHSHRRNAPDRCEPAAGRPERRAG